MGRSRGGLTTKIHLLASGTHTGFAFRIGPGHAHDAPAGRALVSQTVLSRKTKIVMDKGYADNKTRTSLREHGYVPVVPPKRNARKPWKYAKKLYRQRNEIERLFHHLKNFRRIATRYDKLDLTFSSFVALALSIIYLNIC